MAENDNALSAQEILDAINRLVDAIDEIEGPIGLVAIERGGTALCERLARRIQQSDAKRGSVDIALYRDDAATALPSGTVAPSHIPFDVNGMNIVLVDDVLQTGRTVRAAIDCVLDYGRPKRIWLAVLCDRGGRQLPIRPDFVGCELTIPASQKLRITLSQERDRSSVRPMKANQ